jgi:hypothetical protein
MTNPVPTPIRNQQPTTSRIRRSPFRRPRSVRRTSSRLLRRIPTRHSHRDPAHPGTRRHLMATQPHPPPRSRPVRPKPESPIPNSPACHPRPALHAALPPIPKGRGPPPRNPIRAPPRTGARPQARRRPPGTPQTQRNSVGALRSWVRFFKGPGRSVRSTPKAPQRVPPN